MAFRNFSVTLPEDLFEVMELTRHQEHRSRSEMVREALRSYFGSRVVAEDHQVTRQQLAELKRRYERYLEDPSDMLTLEEVERDVRARLSEDRDR